MPLLYIISIFLSFIYNNPPFIHNYHGVFSPSINIEKNSDIIIQEYKGYANKFVPECLRESNPGFTIENTQNEKNCWRAVFLKKAGKLDEQKMQYFPNTLQLMKDKQIHNAFFSILDPDVEIPPHIGYYKGYIRYHMGIVIPNNNTSRIDDKAYIVCGDEKYIWKEKKGIVFDDMYLHHVKNPSNQRRVVLYLDVIRKSDNIIIDKINNFGISLIENSLLLQFFIKNQHNQIKNS